MYGCCNDIGISGAAVDNIELLVVNQSQADATSVLFLWKEELPTGAADLWIGEGVG
jgi:hypothetical protein